MQQTSKPKGLAKIWREVKRPFRKVFSSPGNNGLDSTAPTLSNISNEQITRQKNTRAKSYRESYCDSFIIDKDGKVHLPRVDCNIAFGCNLKCEYCTAISPFRTGIASKVALIDSFEKWSHKISPETIRLLGGEPLLHPDIAEIVVATVHCFPQAQINITTNGLLIARLPDEVLLIFRKHNVHLIISQHMDTDEHNELLGRPIERIKTFRVSHEVYPSHIEWEIHINADHMGVPTPCQSNPEIAFNSCLCGNTALAIDGDYLYRCLRLLNMRQAVLEGALGPEWDKVLAHTPVSFLSSSEMIIDYCMGGPMPECTACPESYSVCEPRQLSTGEIRRIQENIRQRKRKVA